MLPDIAQHNTRYAVSGLGNPGGTGVLSRSYEDLHPNPSAYEVVWSGTIDAQQQKAEQKMLVTVEPPPRVRPATEVDDRPVGDTILEVLAKSSRPLSRGELGVRCNFEGSVLDAGIYRLASAGAIQTDLALNPNHGKSHKKWLRVYSLPKVTKEQAA